MTSGSVQQASWLYAMEGPFVSIYLPAPSNRHDARQVLTLRWKNLRRELERRGAQADDLDALDGAVADGHTGGSTLVAVAAQGRLVLHEMTAQQLTRRLGAVEWLPLLTPMMAWRQGVVRQLVVVADRIGADLTVVEEGEGIERASVVGDTEYVHKPQAGGWSQNRYHRRAENTWERNAVGVADEVSALVDEHDVEIVHVAGDDRAVGLLLAHLPTAVREMAHRAAGSPGATDAQVRRAGASLVAARTADVLAEFGERRGRGHRAVEGVRETLDALNGGRVETLLLDLDLVPSDRRRAWFGADPVPVAASRRSAERLGLVGARPARLREVAARAAIGSGASVRFVPRHGRNAPAEGIGALTRFDP